MLIFVAGVHGVGKGYLCENYVGSNRAVHKSASQLIKEYGNVELTLDKLTADIDRNQLILMAAIDDLKGKKEDILLDGHFSLVTKAGSVEKIGIEIFKGLKLDGVILVKNDLELIKQRLIMRDNKEPIYEINELMSAEQNHARAVCKELGIPLKELLAPTIDDFVMAVEEIGRELKSRTQ